MSRLPQNPRRKLKASTVEIYTKQIRKLDIDLGAYKKQCEDYRKCNKKLQIEKENLSKQLYKLKEDREDAGINEEYESEIKVLNRTIAKNEDTIDKLEQKVQELKSVNNDQQGQIQDLHDEISGLKGQLSQTVIVVSELNNRISKHHQEIQDFRSNHEESIERLMGSFNDNFKTILKEFRREMKGLKSEIVEEVTDSVRSELEERPDPKFYNYNISQMPKSSWE